MQKLAENSHSHSHSHLGGANTSMKNSSSLALNNPNTLDNDPANMSQQHSVLNAFDFAAIDEMDPALGKYIYLYSSFIYENYEKLIVFIAEGHQLLYDREAPFELRI